MGMTLLNRYGEEIWKWFKPEYRKQQEESFQYDIDQKKWNTTNQTTFELLTKTREFKEYFTHDVQATQSNTCFITNLEVLLPGAHRTTNVVKGNDESTRSRATTIADKQSKMTDNQTNERMSLSSSNDTNTERHPNEQIDMTLEEQVPCETVDLTDVDVEENEDENEDALPLENNILGEDVIHVFMNNGMPYPLRPIPDGGSLYKIIVLHQWTTQWEKKPTRPLRSDEDKILYEEWFNEWIEENSAYKELSKQEQQKRANTYSNVYCELSPFYDLDQFTELVSDMTYEIFRSKMCEHKLKLIGPPTLTEETLYVPVFPGTSTQRKNIRKRIESTWLGQQQGILNQLPEFLVWWAKVAEVDLSDLITTVNTEQNPKILYTIQHMMKYMTDTVSNNGDQST